MQWTTETVCEHCGSKLYRPYVPLFESKLEEYSGVLQERLEELVDLLTYGIRRNHSIVVFNSGNPNGKIKLGLMWLR